MIGTNVQIMAILKPNAIVKVILTTSSPFKQIIK